MVQDAEMHNGDVVSSRSRQVRIHVSVGTGAVEFADVSVVSGTTVDAVVVVAVWAGTRVAGRVRTTESPVVTSGDVALRLSTA